MTDLEPVIKSVINHYKWTPNVIDELYCDSIDYKGLMYWYDEVKKIVEQSKIKK